MTVIKNLKEDKENNVNVVKILKKLISVDKTKYLELYLRLLKKEILTYENEFKSRIEEQKIKVGSVRTTLDLNNFETVYMIFLFDFFSNKLSLEEFNQFALLNEENLIIDNDLTKINSFSEIINSIGIARFNKMEKELEKQVFKVYEDDEWVIVRPLSGEASNKYGAGTTWCTSSKNPYTFYNYTRNGILIYTINKRTGFKVATHMYINEGNLTFWNQLDRQMDSLIVGLPDNILNEIRKHITSQCVSNYELCDKRLKERYDKALEENQIKECVSESREIKFPMDELRNEPVEEDMDIGEDVMEAPALKYQSEVYGDRPLGETILSAKKKFYSENENRGVESMDQGEMDQGEMEQPVSERTFSKGSLIKKLSNSSEDMTGMDSDIGGH